jgi:hypothetical protein
MSMSLLAAISGNAPLLLTLVVTTSEASDKSSLVKSVLLGAVEGAVEGELFGLEKKPCPVDS